MKCDRQYNLFFSEKTEYISLTVATVLLVLRGGCEIGYLPLAASLLFLYGGVGEVHSLSAGHRVTPIANSGERSRLQKGNNRVFLLEVNLIFHFSDLIIYTHDIFIVNAHIE